MHKKVSNSTLYQLIEAGHLARLVLLRPLREYRLQPGDDAILLALKNKKSTSDADLSDLTGLGPLLLQKRLDRLLALSLIQRTSFGEHFTPASKLTKSGRRIRKKLITQWRELEDALMHKLSHKEKKQLRHNMRHFADLLSL